MNCKHYFLKQFAIGFYTGWVSMEDEQLQYLSMIMLHSADTVSMKESPLLLTEVGNTKELMDENAVVMQSKISQIKDIFPEYGNGFLAACLEAYNQNPEEVIQRILEGTLHVDLQRLDTSLETMPQPKSAPTLRSKDKGKGKLIESDTNIYTEQPINRPSLPASSASSTTVGRFVRKPKDDTPDYKILDARKETDKDRNAALLAQYEYDDEYDDSFDDLGLSVVESATEESEAFGNRAGSGGGFEPPSAAPKWGSRRNPQFYVKDGKNYSYKVAGAVAVANANEASLINEAEGDKILGLGRGGNIPLGAVRKLTEYQAQRDENSQANVSTSDGRENGRNSRGRGRVRGMANREQPQEKSNENNNNAEVITEAENGGGRGRGRGRRGGGGGRNHNHKDRAMKKHIASVSGF